ncbi:MAG TPA: hypothetical protein PLD92_10770, partial [Candidatus Omnitrophota bacterium]|nr:hypothetical protein [Candidatus Omnitrophota bacterium]
MLAAVWVIFSTPVWAQTTTAQQSEKKTTESGGSSTNTQNFTQVIRMKSQDAALRIKDLMARIESQKQRIRDMQD